MARAWVPCILFILLSGCSSPEPPGEPALETVATGVEQPVYVTHAGDGTDRVHIVERAGRVRMLDGDALVPEPFLDIREQVNSNHIEQGLLGLAFHPQHQENHWVFVTYTDHNNTAVLERYVARDDHIDPASATPVLAVEQPGPMHNGGHITFGPDGYLYWGLGDGHYGVGPNISREAQNTSNLLGSILRIDVDVEQGYTIPPDNPFVAGGHRPEVWGYGLRNPWRFSFDLETGELYLPDVGQARREEINVQPPGEGGQNYGWPMYEGSAPYSRNATPDGLTFPALSYREESLCATSGGYVYRGEALPSLVGDYVFSDFCGGIIMVAHDHQGQWRVEPLLSMPGASFASLGQDADGELYIVDFQAGAVHKLVAS